MSDTEFDKIWTLIGSLWPNAAAKKTKVDMAVWKKGLADFEMADASDAIMTYAKGNKYFPDLADITKHLLPARYSEADEAIINTAKLLAKIRKLPPPDFATKQEAMDWFHGLEAGA